MLDFIRNLFHALGQSPPELPPHAVGYGRVPVPGSKRFIQQLIDYARADNSLQTPLGRLTLSGLSPVPGSTNRMLLSGTIDDNPVTFAPQLPFELVELASGREAEFGAITVQGALLLPEISLGRNGDVLVTFAKPLTLRKTVAENAGRFRRRLADFLTTNLIALRINPASGTPILSGVANWLAPQLDWED